MTEPKYPVGTHVVVIEANTGKKHLTTVTSYYNKYYRLDALITEEDWYTEDDIAYAVKIIPIPETKPYCKDCKNFPEIGKEGYFAAYWSSYKCQLVAWAQLAVTPCSSRMNHSQTQVGNDNYDIELLQPPDNCYCFEPKEEIK